MLEFTPPKVKCILDFCLPYTTLPHLSLLYRTPFHVDLREWPRFFPAHSHAVESWGVFCTRVPSLTCLRWLDQQSPLPSDISKRRTRQQWLCLRRTTRSPGEVHVNVSRRLPRYPLLHACECHRQVLTSITPTVRSLSPNPADEAEKRARRNLPLGCLLNAGLPALSVAFCFDRLWEWPAEILEATRVSSAVSL